MTDGIGDSNDFIASYLFKDANNKDFQASFTNYQKKLFHILIDRDITSAQLDIQAG